MFIDMCCKCDIRFCKVNRWKIIGQNSVNCESICETLRLEFAGDIYGYIYDGRLKVRTF